MTAVEPQSSTIFSANPTAPELDPLIEKYNGIAGMTYKIIFF